MKYIFLLLIFCNSYVSQAMELSEQIKDYIDKERREYCESRIKKFNENTIQEKIELAAQTLHMTVAEIDRLRFLNVRELKKYKFIDFKEFKIYCATYDSYDIECFFRHNTLEFGILIATDDNFTFYVEIPLEEHFCFVIRNNIRQLLEAGLIKPIC